MSLPVALLPVLLLAVLFVTAHVPVELLPTAALPNTVASAATCDAWGNTLFLQLDPDGTIHARLD